MLKNKKIAFIGSGNMAEALIKGLLNSCVIRPEDIIASDVNSNRLKYIRDTYNTEATEDNLEAFKKADIIVLSVKPQIMDKILGQVAGLADNSKLIISIAAGIGLEIIQKALDKEDSASLNIIRAMPNTPALVQTGVTALSRGSGSSEEDIKTASEIFGAVGKVVEVDEGLMDAVTGLSGSGPAYIFMIIEALAEAGAKAGLSEDISMTLSVQTVLGAAKLASETGPPPRNLIDMVASPGGTTIAGIHSLEKDGLKAVIMNAVEAATKRSKELGLINKKQVDR